MPHPRRCPTGEARITRGYDLPAKWVVHTVGPIWRGGRNGEPNQLANCYRNSLTLTREQGAGSVAFPAISTGVYGYPLGPATDIAVGEVIKFLESNVSPERVVFACFGTNAYNAYMTALSALTDQ